MGRTEARSTRPGRQRLQRRSGTLIGRWLVLLLLLEPASAALACDDRDDDGLDVALVLSGGGALATTHIGALAVIEEIGVPIHCVVGTSMGSVVGALYAAGYDAQALRVIFRDSSWPEVFAGQVRRRDEPYLRKEQDDLFLTEYVAGISGDGLKLPGGFRSMAGLRSFYRQLLRRVPLDQDFDALPIPFRAVATDLTTGGPVALAAGDLVEAMLASMAVPGVFAPRHVDGKVLVDGGLAAQLPVSVAQAMGADVIIALDTTIEPPRALESWSVTQVSQQMIRLTVWRNWQEDRARMGPGDVLIRPDLDGLTTSSFERAELGFERGEAEAERFRSALLEIRMRAAPVPHRAPSPDAMPMPTPEALVVENTSGIHDELIARRFHYQRDDFLEPDRVRHKLRDLASFGPFSETDLAFLGENTAVLQTSPLGLGRNLISAGFQASNDFNGESTYEVRGRLSRRPLGGSGSELRISGEIGTDVGLAMEFYQPFGAESRFFVMPSVAYLGEQLRLDLFGVQLGEFWQQRGEGRIRLGRELGDWGILAVDGIVAAVDTRTEVALEQLGSSADNYAGGGLFFGMDTLDRTEWPLVGLQLQAYANRLELLGDGGGTSDRYRFRFVKPFGLRWFDVALRGDWHVVDNPKENPVDILRLGGFRRLSSLPENSLLADSYALGSVEVFRRLSPSDTILSVPSFIGILFEYADVELDILTLPIDDTYQSVAGYLGAETPLGPFYLGVGFGRDGSRALFLHFGRSF